jgi:hypothetical protein
VSGPVEVILIPACGHVPHFQAQEAVLFEMTSFIKSLISVSPNIKSPAVHGRAFYV